MIFQIVIEIIFYLFGFVLFAPRYELYAHIAITTHKGCVFRLCVFSVWQSADNAVTAGYADKQLPIAQLNEQKPMVLSYYTTFT